MKRDRPKKYFLSLKITQSHKGIPYTHRRESGNNTFQNMHKIFTGLENAFAGPGWVWKPHKSKDQIFYIETMSKKISQLRKKITFFLDQKNFEIFFGKKNHEKCSPKIRTFFRFQNFKKI